MFKRRRFVFDNRYHSRSLKLPKHLDGSSFCHTPSDLPRSMHPSPNNVCMLRGKSAPRLIGATLHWRVQRSPPPPAWTLVRVLEPLEQGVHGT